MDARGRSRRSRDPEHTQAPPRNLYWRRAWCAMAQRLAPPSVPPPASQAWPPPSALQPAAVVVQRRRSLLGSQPPAAQPSAGWSVRAAMELEVPDEAESAEAGAVTSEAAWAAESGAAAGNGSGPRIPP